jgi:hypothetical protein
MHLSQPCRLSGLLLALFISSPAICQNPSDRLDRGTLNVVLANKNGFVMAADSRRSSQCQRWSDDSQKVFQMAPKEAIAIAGFASYWSGTPYSTEVAAVMREHFDSRHGDTDRGFFAESWLDVQLLPDIQALAAIGQALQSQPWQRVRGVPPDDFTFIATLAGLGLDGVPHIKQVRFIPTTIKFGPLGNTYYEYEKEVNDVSAEHFRYVTAGIDVWAIRILNGVEQDANPAIVKYLFALAHGTRDDLSLDDMEAVTRRLLAVTAANTTCVGGSDQIAVVPAAGQARWLLISPDPDRRQLLRGSRFALGLTYDGIRPDREPGLIHPDNILQDRNWTRVFANTRFNESKVWLDGNFFIGNLFRNPTFFWNGGVFQLVPEQNWIGGNCTIQFGPAASKKRYPPQFLNAQFLNCEKVSVSKVKFFDYVGFPIHIGIFPAGKPGMSIIILPH